MPDCEAILAGLTNASDALVAACISRNGMHETAEATRYAANLISIRTLLGGAAALCGALIVVWLQTRPARLERSRRTQAFRRLALHSSVGFRVDVTNNSMKSFLPFDPEKIDRIFSAFDKIQPLQVPQGLAYNAWQDASLLTISEYETIIQIQSAVEKYNSTLILVRGYIERISLRKGPLREVYYGPLSTRLTALSGRLDNVRAAVAVSILSLTKSSHPMHKKILYMFSRVTFAGTRISRLVNAPSKSNVKSGSIPQKG